MKLAHLLPVSIIDATPKTQTVHLTLAPLVIRYPEYALYLQTRVHAGHTVIIDNPVHENKPVDPVVWLSAVRRIRSTPGRKGTVIAVIPDVIDDDSVTVKQAEMYAPMVRGLGVQLMAVPHGSEQEDFYRCARKLSTISGVTYLGISLERRFNDDLYASERRLARIKWVRSTEELDPIKIHLLGTSESGNELTGKGFWSRAESTDSSKFAVFALSGQPQWPPVPLNASYPGRAIFGGSMEYFSYTPRFRPYGKQNLTRNLTIWNTYAEGSYE